MKPLFLGWGGRLGGRISSHDGVVEVLLLFCLDRMAQSHSV